MIIAWNCVEFAGDTFSKIYEFVFATQRAFRAHFMLRRSDAVTERKSILLCVESSNGTLRVCFLAYSFLKLKIFFLAMDSIYKLKNNPKRNPFFIKKISRFFSFASHKGRISGKLKRKGYYFLTTFETDSLIWCCIGWVASFSKFWFYFWDRHVWYLSDAKCLTLPSVK